MGEAARRKKLGLPPKEAPVWVERIELLVPKSAVTELQRQRDEQGLKLSVREYAQNVFALGVLTARDHLEQLKAADAAKVAEAAEAEKTTPMGLSGHLTVTKEEAGDAQAE